MICASLFAQRPYNANIESSHTFIYKSIDSTDLKLWVFNPDKHKSTDSKPAIIFFFGGGWQDGSPTQFVKHCEYFSARGIVAMVADYRVKSRHKVDAVSCVADAKSAIRWMREHALDLGIDSNKIIASGGSAGGHLAVSTAIIDKYDDPKENLYVSSKPNALVLFNPVLITAPALGLERFKDQFTRMEARLGVVPSSLSPYHNIKEQLPPIIIFHGTEDSTTPYETAVMFTQKMKDYKNQCLLIGYEEQKHGFFNFGRKSNASFIDTVNKMDEFLVSLGYLEGPPKTIIFED